MKRLDIKIGFACNNRCAFCAQGEKRRASDHRAVPEIARELKLAARAAVKGVVFTGGEPTLHPKIIDLVSLAKTLGFTSIQMQTNGRSLAYPDFCRSLSAAGVTEFSPSLHGSIPGIHDGLVGAPGAWKQVVAGIRNLRRLNARILTNTVVTKQNAHDLPDLAKLLVHLGVSQFQFAFVHIVGSAARRPASLVPKKSAVMTYIQQGLRIGSAAGVACYTEAIPYCLMQGWEHCVAEGHIPDGPVVDLGLKLDSWQDYRQHNGKAKRPECRGCRYDAPCEGPWKEYPGLYGWSEFSPVPEPPHA